MLKRPQASRDLCLALPILTTWDTSRFVAEGHVNRIIKYMMSLPLSEDSLEGLGQTASVVLDK